MTSLKKKIGRLAQGIPGLAEGTDTLDFIIEYEIILEQRKDTTYTQIVYNECPEKEDPNRTRLVVG